MSLWTTKQYAYLFTGSGTSQVVFTAAAAGTGGNNLQVAIVVPNAANAALSTVDSGGNLTTVNVATDANKNPISTAAQVIASVNGTSTLVTASKGNAADGSGIVLGLTATNLAGGVNQSGPNYVDSYPAKDGFRSSLSGELLVSQAVAPVTSGSAAVVTKSVILSNGENILTEAGVRQKSFKFGVVPDVILLALEFDQAVKVVPAGSVVPTIPITIGVNTRNMSYVKNLTYNDEFGAGAIVFSYPIQSTDSAVAGDVQIGTAGVNATHAFGTSNSEVTFTAVTPGTAGNSIQVGLNAPISANIPTLSSTLVNSTITYNLVTSGAVAASLALGTSNTQITFTANALGTSGNSVSITINSGAGALGVVTTVNSVVITLASGGSTVSQVIAACAADSTTHALITATTTGNGTGNVATQTVTDLSGGVNASSTTTVSQLETFVASDPNSASIGVTASTTGNGTGVVAGVAATALSSGANATVTINMNTTAKIVNASDGTTNVTATFVPVYTPNITVN